MPQAIVSRLLGALLGYRVDASRRVLTGELLAKAAPMTVELEPNLHTVRGKPPTYPQQKNIWFGDMKHLECAGLVSRKHLAVHGSGAMAMLKGHDKFRMVADNQATTRNMQTSAVPAPTLENAGGLSNEACVSSTLDLT